MTGQALIDALDPLVSPATKFAFPSAKEAGVGTARWTDWSPPTFAATVKPASVQDLQAVVKYATEQDVPFLAVASGHGYSPAFGKAKDVLEIDLNGFKDVTVNADANTITIGGAVLHSEVIDPLWKAGKQMPIGGCSTTGIVGVTLGGGVNRWQGLWGLHIDNLLEVQLVTASGELVTASKSENEDLFWGIRGAGFNFGIVTSATYRIYDLLDGGKTFIADFVLPFEKSVDIVRVLKQWELDHDARLAAAVGSLWNPDVGGPCHLVSLVFQGPQNEGMKYAQQLLNLEPLVQNIYECPWNEIKDRWAFGVEKITGTYGGLKNLYSGHIKTFDLATFDWFFSELAKLYEEYPACRGTTLLIEDWPRKASAEIPDEETAYPHRDVNTHMVILCATEDPSLGSMLDAWGKKARERFQDTNGFGETKVYVSYGRGDETQEALYGARKLDRLRALKRKWDPKKKFSWNNPILI